MSYPFQTIGFDKPTRSPVGPPVDTGLKAYWKFNESSGDIINQSAAAADLGAAADLQVTGMTYVPSGGASPFGYEGSFDNTNDFCTSGTSLSQYNFLHNTTALWSMAFWLKWTGSGTQIIFATADNLFISDQIGFTLALLDTNAIRIILGNGGGGGARTDHVTTNNTIPNKTGVHFVCITYDESLGSNNLNIRVNNAGLQTFSKEFANSNSNAARAGQIGSIASDGFLGGLVSEFSVWNKVLSDADQTLLYNDGLGVAIY